METFGDPDNKQSMMHSILDEGFNLLFRSREQQRSVQQFEMMCSQQQTNTIESSPLSQGDLILQFQNQSMISQSNEGNQIISIPATATFTRDQPSIFSQPNQMDISNSLSYSKCIEDQIEKSQNTQILDQSSSQKKADFSLDLKQLQQRIMGLQMKIKEDEASTKKIRESTSALKNRLRLAQSPGNHTRLLSQTTFKFENSGSKQNSPLRKLNLTQTESALIIPKERLQRVNKTQVSSSSSSQSEAKKQSSDEDEGIKQTTKELEDLKKQLKLMNDSTISIQKERKQKGVKSKNHSRTSSACSQTSRNREVKTINQQTALRNSSMKSNSRRESLLLSQRSNSSTRRLSHHKQPSLNLLPPFELSSAYEKHRDTYDQTQKYHQLRDKCAKLTLELSTLQSHLREERKKSHQLSTYCVKVKRQRDHYFKLHLSTTPSGDTRNYTPDRNNHNDISDDEGQDELRQELQRMREAFEKSERIREQQMKVIKQMREKQEEQELALKIKEQELQICRQQQQISILDDSIVRPSKKMNNKYKDKENVKRDSNATIVGGTVIKKQSKKV